MKSIHRRLTKIEAVIEGNAAIKVCMAIVATDGSCTYEGQKFENQETCRAAMNAGQDDLTIWLHVTDMSQ